MNFDNQGYVYYRKEGAKRPSYFPLISLLVLCCGRNESCSNDTEEQQIRVQKASFHAYVVMSNQYSYCISVIRFLDFAKVKVRSSVGSIHDPGSKQGSADDF